MDISKIIENKGLTERETEVLKYIIENIDNVNKMGVRGIAKENFTSTSTIMRLSKKLGYSGFLEMQYNLLSIVKNVTDRDINNSNFIDSLNMDSIIEINERKDIDNFIDILLEENSKFIFIYGNGFSSIVAEYINKKLLVMGKRCILSNGTDSIGIFENNLDCISCIIVFSKSGESPMVLNKVKMAKKHNIEVVSFTNEEENSISKLADIRFRVQDTDKLDVRNVMPNTFFPKMLAMIEFIIFECYKRKNNYEK